jgi:4-amino-4-deoxychorismate lyase
MEDSVVIVRSFANCCILQIRLLVNSDGEVEVQHTPLSELPPLCNISDKADTSKPLIVALDAQPTESQSPYVLNKTTQRDLYNTARDRLKCDFHAGEIGREENTFDVLLFNQNGEITETSIANIAIEKEPGVWITPKVECGLLPGVFRRHLLETGQVQEGIIHVDELKSQVRRGNTCIRHILYSSFNIPDHETARVTATYPVF